MLPDIDLDLTICKKIGKGVRLQNGLKVLESKLIL